MTAPQYQSPWLCASKIYSTLPETLRDLLRDIPLASVDQEHEELALHHDTARDLERLGIMLRATPYPPADGVNNARPFFSHTWSATGYRVQQICRASGATLGGIASGLREGHLPLSYALNLLDAQGFSQLLRWFAYQCSVEARRKMYDYSNIPHSAFDTADVGAWLALHPDDFDFDDLLQIRYGALEDFHFDDRAQRMIAGLACIHTIHNDATWAAALCSYMERRITGAATHEPLSRNDIWRNTNDWFRLEIPLLKVEPMGHWKVGSQSNPSLDPEVLDLDAKASLLFHHTNAKWTDAQVMIVEEREDFEVIRWEDDFGSPEHSDLARIQTRDEQAQRLASLCVRWNEAGDDALQDAHKNISELSGYIEDLKANLSIPGRAS